MTLTECIKKLLTALAFALSLCCFAGCAQDAEAKAQITSFMFDTEYNSAINENITASIDDEKGVITVVMPKAVYNDSTIRSQLRASINVASGADLVSSSFDWSLNPVTVTVTANGKNKTYIVNIVLKADEVLNGELLFTEYYCGATPSYKGAVNQYIELTNASNHAIDLSAVELNRYVWDNGSRKSASDQSVTLSGTLASGASYVIYSSRCSLFTSKDASLFVSDAKYNTIIELTGQTSFTLTSYGNVIDAIGPADGEGEGFNWGLTKKMQRKSHVSFYDGFDDNEWYSVKATNSSSDVTTAGSWDRDSSTAKDLTYFAFEKTPDLVYLSNNVINIQKGLSLSQAISVSTNGARVVLAETGDEVSNGHTTVDFSKVTSDDPLELWVYAWDGSCKVYKITYTDITYEKLTQLPENGDEILIYYETDKLALGTGDYESSTTKRAGVSMTPSSNGTLGTAEGVASFVVKDCGNNVYELICNGQYLTTTQTDSGLTLGSTSGDYTKWTIAKSNTDGLFYITSTNALYNGNKQMMEYYQGFRLGSYNASYDYEFSLALYKKL